MAPDMWTGWGIRTLSASNPAFNPYNYQTGSVWPHDNGIIAMGFKLYGFGAEAGRIAHDISIGASHFLLNQLPELYTFKTCRRMADLARKTHHAAIAGARIGTELCT